MIEGRLEDIASGGVSFVVRAEEVPVEEGSLVVLSFRLELEGEARGVERPVRVLRIDEYFDGENDITLLGMQFDEPLTLESLGVQIDD